MGASAFAFPYDAFNVKGGYFFIYTYFFPFIIDLFRDSKHEARM